MCYAETSVNFHRTTQCYNLEDGIVLLLPLTD
jgi:hypothetical protein